MRKIVRYKVAFGISYEDAEAELWARLFRAQVRDKFILNRLVYDPSLGELAFKMYFRRALYNHLANLFRTLARRSNQESPMSGEIIEAFDYRRRYGKDKRSSRAPTQGTKREELDED